MESRIEAIKVIGQSLLEEKARHGISFAIAGGGVTSATIVGYSVALVAFISSLYVMYKTYLEIKLVNIRIENEKKDK